MNINYYYLSLYILIFYVTVRVGCRAAYLSPWARCVWGVAWIKFSVSRSVCLCLPTCVVSDLPWPPTLCRRVVFSIFQNKIGRGCGQFLNFARDHYFIASDLLWCLQFIILLLYFMYRYGSIFFNILYQ